MQNFIQMLLYVISAMTDLVSGQAEETLINLRICNLFLYNVGENMRRTDFVACK